MRLRAAMVRAHFRFWIKLGCFGGGSTHRCSGYADTTSAYADGTPPPKALAARNDSDHSLQFECTPLQQDQNGFYTPAAGPTVPCPVDGQHGGGQPAMLVNGGWQEARGGAIGAQYTMCDLLV